MEKTVEIFKNYLQTRKISASSIKNYLVDIKHFLEWFTLYLKTNQIKFAENQTSSIASYLTAEKIELYKNFLLNNQTAVKTINRRLSALRLFGSLAFAQGWLDHNPAKLVKNISFPEKWQEKNKSNQVIQDILTAFASDLKKQGASQTTIKNYLTDIRQFLNFVNLN